MIQSLRIVSAVLLTTALAASPAAAFTLDLTLLEKAASDTVTDVGDKGDSLGDILTFNNEVFEDGKSAGRDNGWCVRTVVGKMWECFWTTMLKDGQITVAGPFQDAGDSTLVVTGGTGNYAGASGEMKLHPRDDKGTEYDFVFHLTRNTL
jgi:hypothetical protein